MEWQWSDLEVGDSLRINKKLLKYYEKQRGFDDWVKFYKNKVVKVICIREFGINKDKIVIEIDKKCKDYTTEYIIYIKTGKMIYENCPAFKIVKLRKEK